MILFGFHIIDIAIIVAYMFIVVAIGKIVSKNVKGQTDFFLAGRKLGKTIQFFLNFGQMTDANSAASISSFVFKSGIGGIWFGLQTLFMTPYYWFMNLWFRRVRLVTMAELFEDRFSGKSISTLYAIFVICIATIVVGSGYLITARVMEAMMIKSEKDYTDSDIQMLEKYAEYSKLNTMYQNNQLSESQINRYKVLSAFRANNQIKPYATYLNEDVFYVLYAGIIAAYLILGGLGAAAITNTVQGILIIVFSIIMIPFGLVRIGGFEGLQRQVPANMLSMFGDVSAGEFTWYSVLSILLVSWVQIHGGMGNMALGGSAKDEMTARLGAVTGGFCKRLMLIAWGLCGLLAYGLFRDSISNPDTVWGVLTKNLLGTGAIGFMVAGILAANMSTLDGISVQVSALVVRNIYEPLFPNKPEKEYLLAGRITILIVLVSGIFVAKYTQSVLELLKFMLGVNVMFGATVLLIFMWRRLTKTAVVWQVCICMVLLFILPAILPMFGSIKSKPSLLIMTNERFVEQTVISTEEDIAIGIAQDIGQTITKTVIIKPVSIFFENVVLSDPYDPKSQLVGRGRFKVEIYILSLMGMDFKNYSAAGLLTATYLFDSIFPFTILFIVSFLTKRTDEKILSQFYGKMLTPVNPDPQVDALEMVATADNPYRFDRNKLFPNSDWEFKKWNKTDLTGFMLCWVAVGLIMFVLWVVTNLGK